MGAAVNIRETAVFFGVLHGIAGTKRDLLRRKRVVRSSPTVNFCDSPGRGKMMGNNKSCKSPMNRSSGSLNKRFSLC